MLRLLIVAAISLAPLATAVSPCTMGAPGAADALTPHAHHSSHPASVMSHGGAEATAASVGGADPAPMEDGHGHSVAGACADECATHFQVPAVGATRPAALNTARASLASASAPSAPAGAIEHVPLG